MSTHPNAILLLTLKPDGLARKTYRDILRNVYFLALSMAAYQSRHVNASARQS